MIVERLNNGIRYGYNESVLHQNIQEHGFLPYAYAPFQRKLISLQDNALGTIIYIRDLKIANDRLRSALAYQFADFSI